MPEQKRFPLVDILRGIAVTLMVYFHFCYDLSHFGLYATDFYSNAYWIHLRSVIVSVFMLMAGVSLVLAAARNTGYSFFWHRVLLLSGVALAITVVSYFLFPGRTIIFGVLHFIVFASVISRLFLNFKWLNLLIGTGIILLGIFYQNRWFDTPLVHWLGMMTSKPLTEDYAPVFPWFGVILVGMFIGKLMLQENSLKVFLARVYVGKVPTLLSFIGRHSLAIYLAHQMILYPLIAGVAWFI